MSDSIITIIAILVAAILMLIFPVVSISIENTKVTQTVVETLTCDYVGDIAKHGIITLDAYNTFCEKIFATRKLL